MRLWVSSVGQRPSQERQGPDLRPGQGPHSEAGCKGGRPPGSQRRGAACEAETLAGSATGGRPHKQLRNLSQPALAASSGASALSARGWRGQAPREKQEAASAGGSCRFSSWEKPLTAFGERAEGIVGSGCRQAPLSLWDPSNHEAQGPRIRPGLRPCPHPGPRPCPHPGPGGDQRLWAGGSSQPFQLEFTVALNPSP